MDKDEMRKAITEVLKEELPPKDSRVTDIDLFWQIIPHILGGCATNMIDTRPAMQKAFQFARETIGQACTMGLCKPVTVLSDGSQLAMMPSMHGVPPPQQAQPAATPGSGGMVMQYPMNGHGAAMVGPPQTGIPAGGMVAQYPMNMDSPAVYAGGGAPIGQTMDGGVKAVMTRQFPMDPAVAAAVAPMVNQGPQPGTRQYVAAQAAQPMQPPPMQPQQQPMYPQQQQVAQQPFMQPQQAFVQPMQPMQQQPMYPQQQPQPQQGFVQPQPGFVQPQGFQPQQGFVPVTPPQAGFAPVVPPQGQPTPAVAVTPQGAVRIG